MQTCVEGGDWYSYKPHICILAVCVHREEECQAHTHIQTEIHPHMCDVLSDFV